MTICLIKQRWLPKWFRTYVANVAWNNKMSFKIIGELFKKENE